ncbi:hypothetical protein CVT24_002536, partial [Panaeolus cyanescens]
MRLNLSVIGMDSTEISIQAGLKRPRSASPTAETTPKRLKQAIVLPTPPRTKKKPYTSHFLNERYGPRPLRATGSPVAPSFRRTTVAPPLPMALSLAQEEHNMHVETDTQFTFRASEPYPNPDYKMNDQRSQMQNSLESSVSRTYSIAGVCDEYDERVNEEREGVDKSNEVAASSMESVVRRTHSLRVMSDNGDDEEGMLEDISRGGIGIGMDEDDPEEAISNSRSLAASSMESVVS